MSAPLLEKILRETRRDEERMQMWMPHNPRGFSEFPNTEKNLFAYQQDALLNAAKALMLYYGEQGLSIAERKQLLMGKYEGKYCGATAEFSIGKKHAAFPLYEEYMRDDLDWGGDVRGSAFANRMGFWMATGSGKTLVIIKLVDYLLDMMSKKRGEAIPRGNILLLAPSDHALSQIKKTASEYNADRRRMDIRPLHEFNGKKSNYLWKNGTGVYYCRSDLLTEAHKDKQLDWLDYDGGGDWYVLLDEAHKGGREESLRKAYATLMARNRFLFNFSATLTDETDILSAAYSHNLPQFIRAGGGKKIILAKNSFKDIDELTPEAKQALVIESLLALTVARLHARELRKKSGRGEMYHIPIMMTIANTAQTIESKNDLEEFFKVIRLIANGELSGSMLNDAWNNYVKNWEKGDIYSSSDSGHGNAKHLCKPSMEDIRREIFGSPKRGDIKFMTPLKGGRGDDGKQIALMSAQASAPFALIRIGSIKNWTNHILGNIEHVESVNDEGWFQKINDPKSDSFSMLMGSRAFYESWDSVRPNVINFINIGLNRDARIFITQSVGRGVRLEPLPNLRKRRYFLLQDAELEESERQALDAVEDKDALPIETLLIYTASRTVLEEVLNAMEGDTSGADFSPLFSLESGFKKSPRPKMRNNGEMPLLVPVYEEHPPSKLPALNISEDAYSRLCAYAGQVSDSVLVISQGMDALAVKFFHEAVKTAGDGGEQGKDYTLDAIIRMLKNSTKGKEYRHHDKFEDVDREGTLRINHFRKIRTTLKEERHLTKLIGLLTLSPEERKKRKEMLRMASDMSTEEFEAEMEKIPNVNESMFENGSPPLHIRHCPKHYYMPLVSAKGQVDYFHYVIDTESEHKFISKLEEVLQKGKTTEKWNAWMFCKIDEHSDKDIYIPYEGGDGFIHQFRPDFVFWLQRVGKSGKNEYRIVFVDPKGTVHADYLKKIDGYREVYESGGKMKQFVHASAEGEFDVQVKLLMYNKDIRGVPAKYKQYWANDVSKVFE